MMRGSLPTRGAFCLVLVTPWGRFTHAAAETLAGYYWLGSLCKGLVTNLCHSPKEVFKGLANPGTKGDTTCGESVQPLQTCYLV